MKNRECQKLSTEFFNECLAIMGKKRSDYSKDDDAFYNFKKIANMLDVSVEKVFDFFLACKLARLEALLTGTPENETVSDTLIDTANYACLKSIYMKNE